MDLESVCSRDYLLPYVHLQTMTSVGRKNHTFRDLSTP